jgi:hypothetical protein
VQPYEDSLPQDFPISGAYDFELFFEVVVGFYFEIFPKVQ